MSHEESVSIGQIIRRSFIASSVILLAGNYISDMPHPSLVISASAEPAQPTSPDLTSHCAAPSPQTVQTVTTLLDKPGNPIFSDYAASNNSTVGIQAAKESAAKEAGTTIVDLSPDINRLYNNEEGYDHFTFKQVATAGNTALLPFGVDIGVDTQRHDKNKIQAESSTAIKLRDRRRAENTITLLQFMDDKPRDFAATTGLKHVKFFTEADPKSSLVAYVTSSDNWETIHVNDNREVNTSTFGHESTHQLDHKEFDIAGCDMYDDDDYAALNGSPDYYNSDVTFDNSRLNYGQYRDFRSSTRYKMQSAITNGDKSTYCESKQDLTELGANIVEESSYHPNVIEDKAEIGKHVLDPRDYDDMLDDNLPVIERKFRLSVERLYALNQKLATYLISVSSRVQSHDDIVQC